MGSKYDSYWQLRLGDVVNAVTEAVTAVTNTLPEPGLLKFPDSAAAPPGKRPVGDTV